MIVTAALAWWNESPKFLTACVLALGNIADRLVAVDGAYRRYPDATIKSPVSQVRAIRAAAKAAGIECVIVQPDELWAGQVAKRTFLLREAANGSDWVLVVDADHIVHTDRVAARAALEAMSEWVRFVSVDFTTPLAPDRTLDESAATNWHKDVAGTTLDMAVLFRSVPNFEVRGKHWFYWGSRSGPPTEMHYGGKADARLPVSFLVEHRTLFRTEKQVLDSRAFLNDRLMVVARTGQEDDVPGLPRPVWDYVTVPYKPTPFPPTARLREKAAREEVGSPMLTKYRPPEPWSRTDPNVVRSLPEAIGGLAKGYLVMTRLRSSGLAPEIPNGDVIVLGQPDRIEVGSIVLARTKQGSVVQRVVVTADGQYTISDRHSRPTLAKQVYGLVTHHGPHWPTPKVAAVAEKPRRQQVATLTPGVDAKSTVPVKNKGGRPPKKLDGRTKAARALR
jgi:SOS-response transcriptional repressor LexA